MLGDPRHEVVFVGYQAKGTPGAVVQASEGAEGVVKVELDGRMYELRAKVVTLRGYSGHADQLGLVQFAIGRRDVVRRVILVHGEYQAKRLLEAALRRYATTKGGDLQVSIAEAERR